MNRKISSKRAAYNWVYDKFLYLSQTYAFKKRYGNYDKSLFNKTLPSDVIKKYKEKWSVYGVNVEVNTLMLCYNLSGKVDLNIIPENIFAAKIEKKLNPHKELSFFSVKNVYEKWFKDNSAFPKSYFHKIDNIYFDESMNMISNIKEFINDSSILSYPLILKPSKDTYGGAGVSFIKNKDELLEKICEYSYLVCQEKIEQNEYLSQINNSSVNSVRVCLYKTQNGRFEVLNNNIRFGINGGLDNETSGGIVCNINDDGGFSNYAVNKYGVKHYEHPNSGKIFSNLKLPFYNELIEVSKHIADELILCKLVSLDMALDKNNEWRCIELNLAGQTIRFAQYAGKGFFGKYTDEVINRTSTK